MTLTDPPPPPDQPPSTGPGARSGPPPPPKLSVRSPADLLAAVPYLIGFHPADSVVVVALRGSKIVFAARGDLPTPGASAPARDATARHLALVVARQRADSAMIVGYGAATRVTPTVELVGTALREARLRVLEALRVTEGRYWSYLCDAVDCCPAEGTAYDPAATEVAAAATFAGQVALPDRAALANQVAPVVGPAREAMRQATRRADNRLRELVDGAAPPTTADRVVRIAGEAAVRAAMTRHREQGRLTDDELAWLTVLLPHLPVRDHAWERIGDDDWQVTMWTDVVRRVEPGLAAAPASLLAFAAWRAGNGALASVAIDRALHAEPGYPMALLIDEALQLGTPPSMLAEWPQAGGRMPPRRSAGPARRRTRRRRIGT
ncbi:DUF4192 domain-containing protein [Polymorphospora sp. NPDC051019]|uniref:DUF4192 domain-containing protein n=1 Tax=Polymorphospora sp. NPDC051019 TaxID=3155725 RepID=UPI00341E1E42